MYALNAFPFTFFKMFRMMYWFVILLFVVRSVDPRRHPWVEPPLPLPSVMVVLLRPPLTALDKPFHNEHLNSEGTPQRIAVHIRGVILKYFPDNASFNSCNNTSGALLLLLLLLLLS